MKRTKDTFVATGASTARASRLNLQQSPNHEIAEAESGMILESKLRAVIDKVEEVTGMDFDRFTR